VRKCQFFSLFQDATFEVKQSQHPHKGKILKIWRLFFFAGQFLGTGPQSVSFKAPPLGFCNLRLCHRSTCSRLQKRMYHLRLLSLRLTPTHNQIQIQTSVIENCDWFSFKSLTGRNEWGKGCAIPRAWNHYGGAESLKGGTPKIPKMSQVLSSIQYICFQKTCFEHAGARLAFCPGRQLTSLRPCVRVFYFDDGQITWKNYVSCPK